MAFRRWEIANPEGSKHKIGLLDVSRVLTQGLHPAYGSPSCQV
jgi:hypothetical protein